MGVFSAVRGGVPGRKPNGANMRTAFDGAMDSAAGLAAPSSRDHFTVASQQFSIQLTCQCISPSPWILGRGHRREKRMRSSFDA